LIRYSGAMRASILLAAACCVAGVRDGLKESFDEALKEERLSFKISVRIKEVGAEVQRQDGTVRQFAGGVILVSSGELRLIRIGDLAWAFDRAARLWKAYDGTAGRGGHDLIAMVRRWADHRADFKPSRRDCDTPWVDYEIDPAPSALFSSLHAFFPGLKIDESATRLKAEVVDEHRGLGALELNGALAGTRDGKFVKTDIQVRWVRIFEERPAPMAFDDVKVGFNQEMTDALKKATPRAK
jgi:hypothetical protein